ncbi:MAG: hypothetical protein AB8B71_00125 [Paracoccaceae bacterium]
MLSVKPKEFNQSPDRNPLSYSMRQCVPMGLSDGAKCYKMYGLISDRYTPQDLPDAASMDRLVQDASTGWDARFDHPLGFAIMHLADDGNYLLLTRFNNANKLRHRVWAVDPDLSLRPLTDHYAMSCVWEMRLMAFEAHAWTKAVLDSPDLTVNAASSRAYLKKSYAGYL